MSDTQTVEPGTTEEQVAEVEALENAEAPKVIKNLPKACYCSFFEVFGAEEDEVFSTGCTQETKSTFAQGHDARLVSFLVDGHFDGYSLRLVKNGVSTGFSTPTEAAVTASAALGVKAEKATANRQARLDEKNAKAGEREAAKAAKAAEAAKKKAEKAAAKEKAAADKAAAAPREVGAKVVEGSQEGGPLLPPVEAGPAKIKVGRWEYDAEIDENGVATFTNGAGEVQTVERDGFRVLTQD